MAVITDIQMQVKDKKRVSLFLDKKFVCGLQAITVLTHHLKVGQSIDEDTLADICVESEVASAFDKSIKHLSSRQHSRHEIEQYLSQKGYMQVVIEQVINKLIGYKYVDDLAFTQSWVECNKHKNGYHKMQYELINRYGVHSDIVESVLTRLDSSSDINMLIDKLFLNKYKGDKKKMVAYLASRGFDYDKIHSCLSVYKDSAVDFFGE